MQFEMCWLVSGHEGCSVRTMNICKKNALVLRTQSTPFMLYPRCLYSHVMVSVSTRCCLVVTAAGSGPLPQSDLLPD